MSTTMHSHHPAALPVYPGARSARCLYDPPAEYADWRQAEGLQRVRLRYGTPVWVVSRLEDVREVMSDPRISADSRNPNLPSEIDALPALPRMDDPEHIRLRRTLTGEFTVKRIERMRLRIKEVVHYVLDEMVSNRQPADLVRDYALPIPSRVICLLLGVPYGAQEFFQTNSAVLFQSRASATEKMAAGGALFEYLYELTERKKREPGDDIISRQAKYVVKGDLAIEEAVMNGVTLLVAGHATTSSMIALSALTLLQHPEQAAWIRDADDPALMANAVEELLRYLSVAEDAIVRVATEDITIGGQLVRAGDGLIMCLPAANRDAAFFDRPDTLDIGRNARGHVAFGFGTHQCLGQNLARLELQMALPALLGRLPGLCLAVPLERVKLRTGIVGVEELPVTW